MLAAALQELETWAKGLLGDRLSAAMSYVRGAKQSGELGTKVQPRVQSYANTLEALRVATNRYIARASPFVGTDADVAERVQRVSAAYQLLYTQWYEPESVRRATPTDQAKLAANEVGVAPVVAVLVIVTVGGVAWAVTEVGAAYAVAAQSDAEKALANIRLQEKELGDRVAASKDGRTLPPSTLPQPNPAPLSGDNMEQAAKVLVGTLAAAAVVGAVVTFWPRRS